MTEYYCFIAVRDKNDTKTIVNMGPFHKGVFNLSPLATMTHIDKTVKVLQFEQQRCRKSEQ